MFLFDEWERNEKQRKKIILGGLERKAISRGEWNVA